MVTQTQTLPQDAPRIGRYANVLLDRWFKRTFGWAPARRLMQLFLQELIPERTITEISFGPQEHINPIERGKDIRLDVHCTDSNGNKFIVEVQRNDQSTFYERAVFNSSFIIQEQLPPGSTDWDFSPIYFIGIVNFSLHKDSDQVLYRYHLKERFSDEPMTDRIEFLFLEVPNCKNALTPKATQLDKICYALGHISEMDSQPEDFDGEFFDLLFKTAEIANFAPAELNQYIEDMTTERDRINQYNTAVRKGREEGLEQGLEQTARAMKAKGFSDKDICEITGLSPEVVGAL